MTGLVRMRPRPGSEEDRSDRRPASRSLQEPVHGYRPDPEETRSAKRYCLFVRDRSGRPHRFRESASDHGFVELQPDLATQFLDLAKALGLAPRASTRETVPHSAGPAEPRDEIGS
jgi:hypothetical protein